MRPSAEDIVCRLDVFEVTAASRHQELLAGLRSSISSHTEMEGGFAFRLPAQPGLFAQMAELVALERQCCSFVDFRLEWPAADDGFTLVMSGPEGTKEILRPLIGE